MRAIKEFAALFIGTFFFAFVLWVLIWVWDESMPGFEWRLVTKFAVTFGVMAIFMPDDEAEFRPDVAQAKALRKIAEKMPPAQREGEKHGRP